MDLEDIKKYLKTPEFRKQALSEAAKCLDRLMAEIEKSSIYYEAVNHLSDLYNFPQELRKALLVYPFYFCDDTPFDENGIDDPEFLAELKKDNTPEKLFKDLKYRSKIAEAYEAIQKELRNTQ